MQRRQLRHHIKDAKHGVRAEHPSAYRRGSIDLEWLGFPEREQTGDVVNVGVGEKHRLDRRVARTDRWMEARKAFDLLADVGAGVCEIPSLVVGTYGDRRLGSGGCADRAGAKARAITATAVPLWKPTTRAGTEDVDAHVPVISRESARAQKLCPCERSVCSFIFGRRRGIHRRKAPKNLLVSHRPWMTTPLKLGANVWTYVRISLRVKQCP